MSQQKAEKLAVNLGGKPFETVEEGWLVLFDRADGRVVTVSATAVCEYYDRESFESARCYSCISLL